MNTPIAVNPFAGLGQRAGAAPLPDEELADVDFERPSIQRTVPASSAPIPAPAAPVASPFHWRGPGSTPASVDEPPAAQETPPTEENDMKKPPPKVRKERSPKEASPRFQLLSLLQARGDLTREQLLAGVEADARALQNAIFNSKAAGQIEVDASTGRHHLTAAGKAWLTGTPTPPEGKAEPKKRGGRPTKVTKPARKGTPAKKQRARPARKVKASEMAAAGLGRPAGSELAIATLEPVVQRSFRCAVFNDGGLYLEKDGSVIHLSPAEHDELVSYQSRMGPAR